MRENIKNILIIFYFLLFNFIFYYLLILNVIIYKRNKNIHNLIFINKIYIAYNFKKKLIFLGGGGHGPPLSTKIC